MHPRNKHLSGYNFDILVKHLPELSNYLITKHDGESTINFADKSAVLLLNKALLSAYYDIRFWDLPEQFLCPPIPGRADYIHALADLLADDNGGVIPTGKSVRCLDIGTGANLVYPILGQSIYKWRFVGSDINEVAVKVAQNISKANKLNVKVKLQNNADMIFSGIVGPTDYFDITMCNPPFHANAEEALKGTQRKWKNLGLNEKADEKLLNFGGHAPELWCDGGEFGFVKNMIIQSAHFKEQVGWFTCLISKKDNLSPLTKLLKQQKVSRFKTVKMLQGNKQSRFLAWCY
ncbi:23S rRNA (adenine(1618)-N(6))-methyltransferase RlmF [Pseudoalteromonas luteoviolacea]|uniref:23S rRNA (adenine(1618)-N(6))-methyltransferase RlmF n=1 Tax=Pseudoalteromonas luteoviolacea TaxID=43657 RepID=UPI0011532A88|nr:23S rRNA (adenine(1618)-N(6))-methyltransferase RlmF [Pseudoalteromonas luteoviolacea]TQF67521.1 23S rRNA (adenine(1618)-N(6))-methyltransferase RlmF [Pseudoalteromonas luteoviolacea]